MAYYGVSCRAGTSCRSECTSGRFGSLRVASGRFGWPEVPLLCLYSPVGCVRVAPTSLSRGRLAVRLRLHEVYFGPTKSPWTRPELAPIVVYARGPFKRACTHQSGASMPHTGEPCRISREFQPNKGIHLCFIFWRFVLRICLGLVRVFAERWRCLSVCLTFVSCVFWQLSSAFQQHLFESGFSECVLCVFNVFLTEF